MARFDYRWIGKYRENTLVHSPTIYNSTTMVLMFLGFIVKIPISLIMRTY
ncbi:MAG: hypothetical protein ACFFA6_08000 [Promethearchaeota archaeon]